MCLKPYKNRDLEMSWEQMLLLYILRNYNFCMSLISGLQLLVSVLCVPAMKFSF